MNLFLKKKPSAKQQIKESIAPNEILTMFEFAMAMLGVGGLAFAAFLTSGGWGATKRIAVNLFKKLGKIDSARKLETADDSAIQQAITQIKQKTK